MSEGLDSIHWIALRFSSEEELDRETLQRYAFFCEKFTPKIFLSHQRIFLNVAETNPLFPSGYFQSPSFQEHLSSGIQHPFFMGFSKRLSLSWVHTFSEFILGRNPKGGFFYDLSCMFHVLFPLDEDRIRSDSLSRKEKEVISALRTLGLRTLQDLFSYPLDQLSTRFSIPFWDVKECFEGETLFSLTPFSFETPIEEILLFSPDDDVRDLEQMIFLLKEKVEKFFHKLKKKHRSLLKAEVILKCGHRQKDRIIILDFRFPQGDAQFFLRTVRLKLSVDLAKNPLKEGIESIFLKSIRTDDLQSSQSFLFEKDRERIHSVQDLLKTQETLSFLGARFEPEDRLYQLETRSEILPEDAKVKVLRDVIHSQSAHDLKAEARKTPSRPSQFFQNPFLLSHRPGHPFESYGFQGKWYQVITKTQEEIIEGYEWLKDRFSNGVERTYWKMTVYPKSFHSASSPKNEVWWVFLNHQDSQFYLQGKY